MTKSNKLRAMATVAGVSMFATLGASAVSAATVSNSANFDLFCEFDDASGACEDAATVNLTGFDTTLGTLTGVDLAQTSSLGGFGGATTGVVSLDSNEIASATVSGGAFNFMEDLVPGFGLDRFKDTLADFALSLDSQAFGAEWFGSLTITYTFDEGTPPSEVPLPASAGFLALGLMGLGAAGRRKTRK